MTYNGWTNRATWLVNLWVGDTLADMAMEGCDVTADTARDFVEEITDQDISCIAGGMTKDLISFALCDVNWNEVAQAAMEGVAA